MLVQKAALASAVLALATSTLGVRARNDTNRIGKHALKVAYTPDNFFEQFTFFTERDPTNGFVDYVDEATARARNLIYVPADKSSVRLSADIAGVVADGVRGRASVRIHSKAIYNSGLFIIDVAHMPVGCGTWPAIWTYADPWPHKGEIDIVEQTSYAVRNKQALHTQERCHYRNIPMNQKGELFRPDCDLPNGGFDGCSVDTEPGVPSFGVPFNNNKGGVWATLWDETGLRHWFFPRGSVPGDITSGNPSPTAWGRPTADYTFGEHCPARLYTDQNLIINLTFCGDWGARDFPKHCPEIRTTCADWVKNNPDKFKEAFWDIRSIKVYDAKASK